MAKCFTLYHGTSRESAAAIQRDGFRPGSCFTSRRGIAAEYAAGDGVVLKVRLPATSLRYDGPSMDEPVSDPGHFSGAQMDERAKRAWLAYGKRFPARVNAKLGTVSVAAADYWVSLRAVFTVRCPDPLPAGVVLDVIPAVACAK